MEPYENSLSIERLRSEVRMLWNREAAFRDDISALPEVPSHETLWHLVDAARALPWPATWEVGKELQASHPWGTVPAKTELECSAGLWVMIREGIMARQAAQGIVTEGGDSEAAPVSGAN